MGAEWEWLDHMAFAYKPFGGRLVTNDASSESAHKSFGGRLITNDASSECSCLVARAHHELTWSPRAFTLQEGT